MINNFYKAFEDRFRGSRELILSRLQVYTPFLVTLKEIYPNANALDLGCGRGEWLQVLEEHKIQAYGIDIDEQMLEVARELHLHVEKADALTYLRSLPSKSVSVISGFHIVEHLPFDILQELVIEIKRVLMPAGLLIFETPNPENLKVASSYFYIDPTHIRPIPYQLLSFVIEFYGFQRINLLRLQEDPKLNQSDYKLTITDVLDGVSPDYAIVAQNDASEDVLSSFNNTFERMYGIESTHVEGNFQKQLQEENLYFHRKIDEFHRKIDDAQHHAKVAEEQYQSILNSHSWKITSPLRWLMTQVKKLI